MAQSGVRPSDQRIMGGMDWDWFCVSCGNAADGPESVPCAHCGGMQLYGTPVAPAAAMQMEFGGTATAVAHGTSGGSAVASGGHGPSAEIKQALSSLGLESTRHSILTSKLEGDDGAAWIIELHDDHDKHVATTGGFDLIDALLELVRHLTPPGHPDHPDPAPTLDDF